MKGTSMANKRSETSLMTQFVNEFGEEFRNLFGRSPDGDVMCTAAKLLRKNMSFEEVKVWMAYLRNRVNPETFFSMLTVNEHWEVIRHGCRGGEEGIKRVYIPLIRELGSAKRACLAVDVIKDGVCIPFSVLKDTRYSLKKLYTLLYYCRICGFDLTPAVKPSMTLEETEHACLDYTEKVKKELEQESERIARLPDEEAIKAWGHLKYRVLEHTNCDVTGKATCLLMRGCAFYVRRERKKLERNGDVGCEDMWYELT